MRNIISTILLSFIFSVLLFSCGTDTDNNTKNIKFTIFTQSVKEYPKLNDELIDIILPFQNEETKDKFLPQVFVQRIDLDVPKQEIKVEISTGGLKTKIDNLQKKFRKEYSNFELPKEFVAQTNSKAITKQSYFQKLQSDGDTTIVFLFGKNKSWEFLRDTTSKIIVVEVDNVEDFRKKIIEFTTKQPKAGLAVIYNVNFIIENTIDPITEALGKTDELVAGINAKRQALKTADSLKQEIQDRITKVGNIKPTDKEDAAKLSERVKTLKSLLKQKEDEIANLKTEIKQLNGELKTLRGELNTEREEHTKTKGRLVQTEQKNTELTEENTTLANDKEQIKRNKVESDINNLLAQGKSNTRLITLENGKVQFWKEKGGGSLVEMTMWNTKASTYEERRKEYKRKVCEYYGEAYKLAKQHNISLEKVKGEAETKMEVYYALVKEAKLKGEITYNNVVDFLEACN